MSTFMERLRLVIAELARPSAQRDDWFGWSAGQAAHAMIGAVLAGALLFFFAPIWSFLIAASGYALLKEVPDFFRAPGWATARDCTQDALFVAAGAALAVAIAGAHDRLFLVAAGAALVGLGVGIYERVRT